MSLLQAESLLAGAYDLHVHPSPSRRRRIVDDIELVRAAAGFKMAGVMLKCHHEPTAARAEIANRYANCPNTLAYGALALNLAVGGLNPYAVENALAMGARFIWLPTADSAAELAQWAKPSPGALARDGISLCGEDGRLLPQVYEIFELARAAGVFIGTGHVSVGEARLVCLEGRRCGVDMVLTHPDYSHTKTPLSVQQELCELGVLIEKAYFALDNGDVSCEDFAGSIRALGAENCLLSTDRGQVGREAPAFAYRHLIARLLEAGISEAQIVTMSRTVPMRVLGLS